MGGETYWLGTDAQGRDMLSAIFYGLRISLLVGLVATAIALVIGIAVGLTAAVFGGKVDTLLMRLVDFILGLPTRMAAHPEIPSEKSDGCPLSQMKEGTSSGMVL
ncbi:hypothetical protein NKZ03_30475 [Sinorhizobium meliloti]|uniref:hypothetical protein n=1 Tax=Rhizobium meliloti TaxID=382 RepID=UPI00299EE199|nr:hypothetical protein [Sinorhizobium meliloti]